jgi:Spy/CpxP family protein refolding chaperone
VGGVHWRACVAGLVVAPVFAFGCAASSQSAPPAAPGATPATSAAASAPQTASSAAAAAPPVGSASAEATAQAAPSEDEDATNDLIEHHRHHHHGGVTRFVAMSLDTLGVSPEQQASVDRIQADLRAKLEPSRAADEAFMTLLADGVAAGSIDKAKVDAAIAKIAAASSKAQAASEDALKQLHAVLTPPQRAALVDKIEAHWHVWEEANETAETTEKTRESGHLERLAGELSLTPDQVEKIRAGVHAPPASAAAHYDRKEVQARVEAFGAAFSGETFDAKALHAKGADAVDAHIASHGAARMARFFEAVAPVLTPDQRTKLAAELREHAAEKSEAQGT